MACLLTQPQQNLQLNYKTIITQNPQKIEPYETKELKKSHSFRQVGWAEMQRHGDTEQTGPIPMYMGKIGKGISGTRDPSLT